MNRRRTFILLGAALSSSIVLASPRARADSLVTIDGDMMVGPITKTATGFTIQTADGPVDLPTAKVKRVLYDHPPAAAVPAPDAPKSSTAVSIAPANPKQIKTLSALLDQGKTAMAASEFSDARDAFKDALKIDPKNIVAGRGLGFAYILLGNTARALDPLEVAALNQQPDRGLVLAISAALVANQNPMRAVIFLKPYLEAHSNPVDETMLNALGIALSEGESSATRTTLFKDSVKLYFKLNTTLEATRPGKRRWGMEWEDAGDVSTKEAARQTAQQKVDDASSKLQTAGNQLQSAENDLSKAQKTTGRKQEAQVNKAQQSVNQATENQNTAQTNYDAAELALAAVPRGVFPKIITVDNADLVSTSASVVASVTPLVSGTAGAASERAAPPAAVVVTPNPAVAEPADPAPAAATAVAAARAAAKHVTRYAVGFAIAPDVFVTASSALDSATSISIESADGKPMPATVIQTHQADGLALLKIEGAKFPCLMVAGTMGDGAVSCLGFPEVDLFNPLPRSMNVGAGPATDPWTVHFDTSPRLPGGPLLQNGAVVGVELGDRDSDTAAVPAAALKALQSIVGDAGHGDAILTDPKQAIVQVMVER